MDRVALTLEFLNKKFAESKYLNNHLKDKKYRYEHTLRVANIGKTIAEKEGFNVEAMVVACLLHDVSYCEEFTSEDGWRGHGRMAAKIARPFVQSLGFDENVENDILYGIAIHVDDKADFIGERTPFALCIGDADNIDRFDTYRIYETLQYEKFDELLLEEQLQICTNRIERLNQFVNEPFGTETSTKMFHEKVSFQIQFYNHLKSQLEKSVKIY